MDITGFGYLVFFAAVLIGHRALQAHHRYQKLFLTAASYYFYMTIDWRFGGLLVYLSIVNHSAGGVVARQTNYRTKRLALTASILLSLGVLFYFKYLNFFAEMANTLAEWLGGSSLVPYVNVLLPVGISFMTFQAITYPVDLIQGRLKQPCSFLDFSLFMAFFPRLLSGPIVRSTQFLPQLEVAQVRISDEERLRGMVLIMQGLVKKVLIADMLGLHLVDPAFSAPGSFSSAFLLIAMFGYSLQVYFDLSGYTNMAIGSALMLGYRLPQNFNRPYLATSIANFWQRWHITMSSFFRDYLYNNLANTGYAPIYVILLIVFVAIGLWHGAGWNFVTYGIVHGSLVGFEHWRSGRRLRAGLSSPVYRGVSLVLRVVQIFLIVSLTRILFRGNDLSTASEYLTSMLKLQTGTFPLSGMAVAAFTAATALHFSPVRLRDECTRLIVNVPVWLFALSFVATVYAVIAFSHGQSGFIYFQF